MPSCFLPPWTELQDFFISLGELKLTSLLLGHPLLLPFLPSHYPYCGSRNRGQHSEEDQNPTTTIRRAFPQMEPKRQRGPSPPKSPVPEVSYNLHVLYQLVIIHGHSHNLLESWVYANISFGSMCPKEDLPPLSSPLVALLVRT